MSASLATQSAAGSARLGRRWRRFVLVGLIGILGVLVINGGLYWWFVYSRVDVPKLPAEAGVEADVVIALRIEEGRNAVRANPSSPETWGRLGMLFYTHRYPDEAATCFIEAERLDPEEPRWKYFQAVILEQTNRVAALRKFEETLEKCGEHPPSVRLRYADFLYKESQLAEAEQHYRIVLQRDGSNARAHLGLARIATRNGDFDAALKHLERSMEDPAGQRESHLLLSEIYERSGRNDLAVQHHRAAENSIRIGWDDPYIEEAGELRTGLKQYLSRTVSLHKQGRYQQALDLALRMTKVYPDSPQVWATLGKSQIGLGDWAGAEDAYRRAIEIDPELLEAQFQLGLVFEHKEDFKEAASWFRRATTIKPFYADAHYHLGLALTHLQDPRGAIDAFRTALRCQPNMNDAHLALAMELDQSGQSLEALFHTQAVLNNNPGNANARKLLRQLLARATFPTVP
jgi:tetratricopeptide (TPR) repeat protein